YIDLALKHRRHPEGIGGAAGEALLAARKPDDEGRRDSRERIGDLEPPVRYVDEVGRVELGQLFPTRRSALFGEGGHDVVGGDGARPRQERLEHLPEYHPLTRDRPAPVPPCFQLRINELVGRLDLEHRLPLLCGDDRVCSGYRLKRYLRRTQDGGCGGSAGD